MPIAIRRQQAYNDRVTESEIRAITRNAGPLEPWESAYLDTPSDRADLAVRAAVLLGTRHNSTLHNNGTRRTTQPGTPRTRLHQVFCSRCGCGNVDREPHDRTAAVMRYGCGVTRHATCTGCRCHTEPKPWRKNWKRPANLPDLIETWLHV